MASATHPRHHKNALSVDVTLAVLHDEEEPKNLRTRLSLSMTRRPVPRTSDRQTPSRYRAKLQKLRIDRVTIARIELQSSPESQLGSLSSPLSFERNLLVIYTPTLVTHIWQHPLNPVTLGSHGIYTPILNYLNNVGSFR
jgi:hypothetical protein